MIQAWQRMNEMWLAGLKHLVIAILGVLILIGVFAGLEFLSGCSAVQNRRAADGFLNAAQIACALRAQITDDKTIAEICGIEEALRPSLRELLSGKAAAARGGGIRCAADAGAP